MFNLIVAVISIALIAAMAGASLFYGGAAFTESTAAAKATTLVNSGAQIAGAQQLHMIDNSGTRAGATATTVAASTLVPAYLQAAPTAPRDVAATNAEWRLEDGGKVAAIELDPAAASQVCVDAAEQGGIAYDGASTVSTAAAATIALADMTTSQFGCIENSETTPKLFFVFAL
jgi:hypothetical protein